jgi:carbonic anhydrase
MRSSFGLSRRAVLGCACCAGVAATMARLPLAWAAGTHEASGISPDEALALLKEGNAEFVADEPFRAARGPKRRLETAKQQKPFAVLVGCSDSRVAPELLFSRGLGELFVIRVAGNTLSAEVAGSMQYAGTHLHTQLFVVLGHEQCGAVHAAMATKFEGARHRERIQVLVDAIVPGLSEPDPRSSPDAQLARAVEENVRWTVRRVLQTPEAAARQAEGRMKLVGAVYDIGSGRVRFLPEQQGLA